MVLPKNKLFRFFIDTDFFVALKKKDDAHHEKSGALMDVFEKTRAVFMTSNYVTSEVITVLSQRVGHKAAVDFIETMRSSTSNITIEWITQDIEDLAVDIFNVQKSKNVSFVDCTNMAIMSYYHVDAIFSFDATYPKNGLTLVQDLPVK